MRRLGGGGVGSTPRWSTTDATAATLSDRSSSMVSSHRRPPSAKMLGDHRVESENRCVNRYAVDLLEMRHQRSYRASHRHSRHRDRTGLRSQPSDDRADLRYHPHHARNVVQRIHVGIGRPCVAPRTVTGLHRQCDVEARVRPESAGLARTAGRSVGPDRRRAPTPARAAIVTRATQVHDSGRRTAEAFGRQRLR